MRGGGKRSAPTLTASTPDPAGTVFLVGSVSVAAALVVAALLVFNGAGEPVGRLPSAVATANTPAERHAGVRAHPLQPGQRLLFTWRAQAHPGWTMSGVSYPLIVRGLPSGDPVRMGPCPDGTETSCPVYDAGPARVFVETRPARGP